MALSTSGWLGVMGAGAPSGGRYASIIKRQRCRTDGVSPDLGGRGITACRSRASFLDGPSVLF
jgi:hypothetical protein